jgi:transcriptional regulator with XRE-family HTH domain
LTLPWFHDDNATLGDRLMAAREAAGLSAADLSSHVGVRAKTLENWEADRSEPRANRVQMLAGVLGVSIVWLLTGEGEGGVDPAAAAPSGEAGAATAELAEELRDIRQQQHRLLDRLAALEQRLRSSGA